MLSPVTVVQSSRRLAARRGVFALAAAAVLTASGHAAGQSETIRAVVKGVTLDSQRVGNAGGRAASVFNQDVSSEGAPWVRVVFDAAELEAGSYVLVTSLTDGEFQVLNAEAMAQWQFTTAFFNGDRVSVQLIAAPGSTRNRVTVSRIIAGDRAPQPPEGDGLRRVCVGADNRVPSADLRAARMLSITLPVPACPGGPPGGGLPCGTVSVGSCSGNMTSVPVTGDPNNRVFVSAGHCFTGGIGSTVVQFEPIPNSDAATCTMRHPPVAKQFVIDRSRVQFSDQGPGNDWSAFVCFANPNTGQTPFQEQDTEAGFTDGFTLAAAAPAVGAAIRKFGYGADGAPGTTDPHCRCVPGAPESARNVTQQESNGTVSAVTNLALCYNVHTCPGDSGGGLINAADELVGVNTAGSCDPSNTFSPPCPPDAGNPRNVGTNILAPNFRAGIAAVAGGGPPNDACDGAIAVVDGSTVFSTLGATTDGTPDVACDANGSRAITNDIWFRYTVPAAPGQPAGTAVRIGFTTRGTSFNTRLAIYNPGCPVAAHTALECDDDGLTACAGGGASTASYLTRMINVGSTVLIRVGGHNGATGRGVLTVGRVPANDTCANAENLGVGVVGTIPFDTMLACTDGPAPAAGAGCFGQIQNDVWFVYEARFGGHCRLETCADTNFDSQIAVYGPFAGAPPCGGLGAPLACNDDTAGCGDGRMSRAVFATTAGQTYLIRVGSTINPAGRGVLRVVSENDSCADAFDITPSMPGSQRMFHAGADTDGPAACGMGADLWLRYTHAGAAQVLEVNTCEGAPAVATNFNTVLAAYQGAGCAPVGTQQACNDDSCGAGSRITFQVNNATTYLIRVGGAGGAADTSNVTYRLRPLTPANDQCANAQVVGAGLHGFSNIGATTDGEVGIVCNDNPELYPLDDIWFRYDHPAAGAGGVVQQLEVNTCEVAATFDTALVAYQGVACAPEGAILVCNDNTCGTGSRLVFTVNPGTSYLIRLGNGASAPTGGTGSLRVRLLPAGPAPGNDLCANALPIGNGATAYSTTGATTDGPAAAGCAIGQDIWFTYTATCSGPVGIDTCTSLGYDSFVAVYGGGCGALGGELACNDDTPGCGATGRGSRLTFTAANGSTYRIRVGGAAASDGAGVLTIAPIGNDSCANAAVASNGANPFCTTGATTDGDNLCGPAITNDVWFRYTATSSSWTWFNTCGANFDTNLAVYESSACPPNNLLECNDDANFGPIFGGCKVGAANVATSAILRRTTIGTVYTIRVGGVFGATGSGTLTIRPCFNDSVGGAAPGLADAQNGQNPFNTTCATTEAAFNPTPGGAGGCGGIDIDNDIWFLYRATASGATSFATCGSGFDTAIAVYDSGLNMLRCGNDAGCGGGNNERIQVSTVAGVLYVVRVGSNGGAAGGAGTLTITPPGFSQPNNDCANALTAQLGANLFDSTGSTTDGPAHAACDFASCDLVNYNTISSDVWYRFTPDATGTYVADTCAGATFDTKIAVYGPFAGNTINCAALPAPAACNDDDVAGGCPFRSKVTFAGTAGRVMLIRVGGSPACVPDAGAGVLTIKFAPASDNCGTYRMALLGANVFDSTVATTDGPVPPPATACPVNKDIWFRYDSGATRRLKVSLCGSTFDSALAVYRSTDCPPVNQIGCNDNSPACGAASTQSQMLVNVKAGTVYTVRVGGSGGAAGPGVLTLTAFCAADWDASGVLTPVDVALMVNQWFADLTAGVPGDGDFDANGAINPADIAAFVNEWLAELQNGCP